MKKQNIFKDFLLPFLPFLFIVCFIILAKFHSYLFFHTSVEVFSMIVAVSTFLFAWNTRKISGNNFFLFLGTAYLFTSIILFFHTLSYKGMEIFKEQNSNLPTQLWIASRYLLAFSLLAAPLFLDKKFYSFRILLLYSIVTLSILYSVFYLGIFPTSYVDGIGLTPFKIISEYIISAIFFIAIVILMRLRNKFDQKVFLLLSSSLILNVVSELMFTLYIGVYDIFNFFGHIFIFISYYLMYKAIIEVGLTRPYNLLFLELNELDKKKDDFLSIASHEIKNPLTAIRLSSELAAQRFIKNRDRKNLRYVNEVKEETDKINRMINDLLDVSRIESGRLKYNFIRLDFDAFIKDILKESKYLIGNRKLIHRGKTRLFIKGDKGRLGQVIGNLIGNAAKYSHDGTEIILTVTADKEQVIVSVRDFGIGILKNKRTHIFEKYYRTQSGENRAQGLGLGLYIAKEIITAHNGSIWVESKKDKGSTFYFSLPIN